MPGAEVHLVQSNQKKASFLREAECDHCPCRPLCTRSELKILLRETTRRFYVVTARALAPLDRLIDYAIPLLKTGAVGLFPKGQDVAAELTQAAKSWKIDADLIPSKTDPHGRIVLVRHAAMR